MVVPASYIIWSTASVGPEFRHIRIRDCHKPWSRITKADGISYYPGYYFTINIGTSYRSYRSISRTVFSPHYHSITRSGRS